MLSRISPFTKGRRLVNLAKNTRRAISFKNQVKYSQSLLNIPSKKFCQMETVRTANAHESKDIVQDTPRGIHRRPYTLKVGDSVHGYTVKDIKDIPDFSLKAFTLEHDKTGAKHLHLDSADMENVSLKEI